MKRSIFQKAVFLVAGAFVVSGFSATWEKVYQDLRNGQSVAQTSDGGYIVAGEIGSSSARNIKAIRLDSKGDTLWSKTYGGAEMENCFLVRQLSDGGFLICGETNSYKTNPALDFHRKGYVVRTKSNGDTVWAKAYGIDSNSIWIQGAEVLSDGGCLLTGYTGKYPYWDICVIKVKADGTQEWLAIHPKPGTTERMFAITPVGTDGFCATGMIEDTGTYEESIYIVRFKANGDTLWTKRYTVEEKPASGYAIKQVADGGLIIAGENREEYNADGALVKLTADGAIQWSKVTGGEKSDSYASLAILPNGDYLMGGTTESSGAGEKDFWLVRTNKDGDTIWTKTFGSSGKEVLKSMYPTSDGGVIMSGTRVDTVALLVYTDLNKTGVQKSIMAHRPAGTVSYVYNPANKSIFINNASPFTGTVQAFLYGPNGRRIAAFSPVAGNARTLTFSRENSSISRGNYIIHVSDETMDCAKSIVIK